MIHSREKKIFLENQSEIFQLMYDLFTFHELYRSMEMCL